MTKSCTTPHQLLVHGVRVADPTSILAALKRGANVNDPSVQPGEQSLLSYAILNCGSRVAELLLAAGADVAVADNKGYTPLHYAANCNDLTIAKRLIDRGATINTPATNGETPLHTAAVHSNSDFINLLLAHGAARGALTDSGETALQYAARYGRSEIVDLLGDTRKPRAFAYRDQARMSERRR